MGNKKKIGGLYQLGLERSQIRFDHGKDTSYFLVRHCYFVDGKICNKSFYIKRCEVHSGSDESILMLVKHLDFTRETAETVSDNWEMKGNGARNHITANVAVADVVAVSNWELDWSSVSTQWKESSLHPGSVFLAPDGNLIWISDIDFKYYKEVEL